MFTRRFAAIAGVATAAAAFFVVAPAAPATACACGIDRVLVHRLVRDNIHITSWGVALNAANNVCKLLSDGASEDDASKLVQWQLPELNPLQATRFVTDSTDVICPQYAAHSQA